VAVRNILKFGDPVLRKQSKTVSDFDEKLWMLLDDLTQTLKNENGVGLAAPQVGILRRAVVIDIGDGLIELVNPVVAKMKGKQREIEGCLSSNGEWGYVKRPMKVTVTAQNRHGEEFAVEGEGLLAIALCHEIDHLNGILFIDKADEMVDREDVEEARSKRDKKR
jgi:peptide deformylase